MPKFDESAIRKAAAWQDFKEAQSLLNIGAVLTSSELQNGWSGSVKIGTRTYRATVDMKTPTWFDASCPCPASRREGKFCSHAIAIGLHLLNPPALQPTTPPEKPKAPTKTASSPSTSPVPEISWKIKLQGPWQKTIQSGRLSATLSPSEHPPTPADRRLTSWLISQKATSSANIQLALSAENLPGFLAAIIGHPEVTSSEHHLEIDSGTQLHLADCRLTDGKIRLTPASQNQTILLHNTAFQISENKISKIGNQEISSPILPIFQKLSAGTATQIPTETFLLHLETLQDFIDFSASDWFESLHFITVPPDIEIILNGSERKVTATLHTSYSQSLPRLENHKVFTKQTSAEQKAASEFASVFRNLAENDSVPFIISDPESIQQLLTKSLKQLPSTWSVSLSPALQKHSKSFVFITPNFQFHSSNEKSVNFSISYQTSENTQISTEELRRLLRLKTSKGIQDRGKKIIISPEIEDLIDPLFEDLEIEQSNGRFTAKNASASIIEEISKNLSNNLNKNGLQKQTSIPTQNLPQIQATLRPYQITGYSWLMDRLQKYHGALLADDMGLGKTIQTIACIEHLLTSYSQGQTALIVVTTSLLGNWKSEINRFTPHRNVITLHGPSRDKLREKIKPGDIVLTTYATLARDLAYHLRQNYVVAVIDEASLIRNPDTDHSKAVAKLNADRRIALTGTPVENSARDLWSIFRFIQPGWLGTRKAFENKYEHPLKSPDSAFAASRLLRIKTSPFVLRRTKSEVAPELPSKIQIDEFCDLSKDQLATYREIQKQGIEKISQIRDSGQTAAARMQTLTLLLRLRQTCCDLSLLGIEKLGKLPIPRRSSKLERLLEITTQSLAADSRILIFSQFQKQLLAIEEQLTGLEIPSLRLDGKTRNRQALVDEFQSPSGPPVFLISLKAGGYGLNLTAADVVIHFDPWWNPAAEAQATDRAHRIGQTKPVTVYRLLTRNTVEEKVTRMQQTKKALADSLDESITPTDAPGWNQNELAKLLE